MIAADSINPNLALIAPLIVTVLLAVLTVVSNLWTASAARKAEERRLATEREVETARWLRERRADAYVQIIEYQFLDERSDSERGAAVAPVYAYGSKEVVEALDAWRFRAPDADRDALWANLTSAINRDLRPGS